MPYLYHTDDDRRTMLDSLGLSSEEELFEQIPKEFRLRDGLAIDDGLTEYETLEYFGRLAATNRPAGDRVSFLGGGIYDHVIPSIVGHLAGRSEFYTAYTPYQAEVSQGTLQVIFEYQSLISRLTGLPVANASMYDGATAFAESALMAAKITRRSELLYAANVNPRYLAVLDTYAAGQDLTLTPIPADEAGQIDGAALGARLSDNVAAVMLQTPNYYGVLEAPWRYRDAIKSAGALLVVAVNPISLSLFQSPGDYEADIAVGEGQSLGNPMNFGGPLLGFMACRSEFIRNLPGRLVSETKDIDGKRAYVLTLQTREQHIRRERATSNICTNQGLLALRSTIYLSTLGEGGFHELGKTCHARAHQLASMITTRPGYRLRFAGPFFNEFVITCRTDASVIVDRALDDGILAGIPLAKYAGKSATHDLLIAVTEKRTDDDFDALCRVLDSV